MAEIGMTRALHSSIVFIALIAACFLTVSLRGQERAPISAEVRPFVSIDAPIVALTHARVIDGTGAPVRDDQTVMIAGTRITAVGSTASTTIPAGARVVDLTGHTVIPGLHPRACDTWHRCRLDTRCV